MTREYRYKSGKYVEDSTKGKSMLMPKSYKGDALVQVWLDSRKLALLSAWVDQDSDRPTRFLSEVVRATVDAVVEVLKEQGWNFKSFEESREMLNRKYRVDLNPRGKGLKNLRHNKILESLKEEEYEPMYAPSAGADAGGSEWDEDKRRYIDEVIREEREKARTRQYNESLEAARASGIIYKEDRETMVHEGMSAEEVNARQEAKDREQNEAMRALGGAPQCVVKP